MNVLAIGAHFDDIELGCGGALARHLHHGDAVHVYVATSSGYSNPKGETVRCNETALAEGRAAMALLGVEDLTIGSFQTFEVEFCDRLNMEILALIERHRIDLVYTHWAGDIHHDHQAVARATIHAGRHVPNILMYRSNWYESGVPFRGNFYVDISDFWAMKERLILAHESEVERTGRRWLRYFQAEAECAGQRIGVRYAETFEVVKWLAR